MNWQEELKNIEWEGLETPYGTTQEVPKIIRTWFLSENCATQINCLKELGEWIYHQGTIYEITAYVLPFLLELLEIKSGKIKADIFVLIAIIYGGKYRRKVTKNVKLVIYQNRAKLKNFVNSVEDEEPQFLCEYAMDSFEGFTLMINFPEY